jgi:predicted metal-dependent hydrolase
MEYKIKVNSRSKKITLKIKSNGDLIITTPPLVPKFLIKKFVKQNEAWIKEKQQQRKEVSPKFIGKNFLYLFGKKYPLKIVETPGPSRVMLKKEEIVLNIHDSGKKIDFDFTNPPMVLTRFIKNTAQHYITKKAATMAKKMKLEYKKIGFKAQKTRWGSCSSRKNLNFNWRLAHFKPEIIDYVVIHELAHLEQMNHSRDFWELVEKHHPEYRIHRGWLKRQGGSID